MRGTPVVECPKGSGSVGEVPSRRTADPRMQRGRRRMQCKGGEDFGVVNLDTEAKITMVCIV